MLQYSRDEPDQGAFNGVIQRPRLCSGVDEKLSSVFNSIPDQHSKELAARHSPFLTQVWAVLPHALAD
jgi:hypothetical protein